MTVYSYSPGIPNPPNDPADDVSTMQSNAASIAGIIAVDHVQFGVMGNGQHNQVTFNSNLPPTFPTSFPIIFRNNQDGAATPNTLPLPAPFIALGNGTFNSKTQNIVSGSGSIILFGGIILKWGTYTISGTASSADVSFINAFPTSLFGVNISCITSGSIGDLQINYTPNSPSGFVGRRQGSSPTAPTYFYIAIGN